MAQQKSLGDLEHQVMEFLWHNGPSTGDVVHNTRSIQGGLPKSRDGHSLVVSIRLELSRDSACTAWFSVEGVESRSIALPKGSAVLPAACFLRESQRVSLAGFRTE